MRIDTPSLRADGFKVELNTGYGKPWGDIILTEDGRTRLQWVHEDDCDQIIKAAAELKSQIIASRALAAAPHGRGHMYKDRCQLCGNAEDDELHAEPALYTSNSGRDCDQANPETGHGCQRSGDHGVHRDAYGDEWRTDEPGNCATCSHPKGSHMSGSPRPCAMPGCDCGKFRPADGPGGVLLPAAVDPDNAPAACSSHGGTAEPAACWECQGATGEAAGQ